MDQKNILKKDEQAIFALRGLYRSFGYLPYKMSRFEEYDLYVRNKDFLVSDQFITFADKNGKLLALKPDVTLSIIKNSPDTPGTVQKLYYDEHVYRADKSGHTIREILQTGLECVGDLDFYEIAEVLLLATKSLALLGSDFVLDISHMGLIAAVMETCGVSDDDRADVLRCLRQKNSHELCELCCEMSDESKKKLMLLVDSSGSVGQVIRDLKGVVSTEKECSTLAELEQLCDILKNCGYGDSLRIDFSVGSDLKYYSGVVFKGYLSGIPSSILSGGQYDKLLKKMGKSSRAIGFALYLDLLQRQGAGGSPDVDVLILHDGTISVSKLIRVSADAAEKGSVLVAAEYPEGRSWGRVIDLRGGRTDG